MDKIEQVVISCYQEILDEAKIEKTASLDMKASRENGIDSLGSVNLILKIEEELDIDLDDYLKEIRNAESIGAIVSIIRKALTQG